MEAIQNLINEFGSRLEHTLPRIRRWTMQKRPRNFVKKMLQLEANIRSGEVGYLHTHIYIYKIVYNILGLYYYDIIAGSSVGGIGGNG